MTPEEILDQAADYIHEHGWCRGTLQNTAGEVCIQGAVTIVDPVSRKFDCPNSRVIVALSAAIADASGHSTTPWSWNDDVCRDADEAVHLLKKAKEFL